MAIGIGFQDQPFLEVLNEDLEMLTVSDSILVFRENTAGNIEVLI